MMQPTGSPTRIKIDFAQASDPGRDPNKQVNEDSCGYAESRFGHLAVLCDGMGGHYGGKEASRTAITTIFEVMDQTPPGTPPSAALKAAIEEAGRRVYRLGGMAENRTRPGSTVVAMILHDRGADVAHVGDSRAYVIRANQIYPLTRDHSMVQGMIDAGMLTEQQALGHPDANKITRALGMKPEVEVELRPEPMELYVGDVLLMASDGLTDLALAADILSCTQQALASGSVEYACNRLVQLANDRGGHDNITVQMARVLETGSRTLTVPDGGGFTHQAALRSQSPLESPQAGALAPSGQPQETLAMIRAEDVAPPAGGVLQPLQPAPTAPWGPIPPTSPDTAGPGLMALGFGVAGLPGGAPDVSGAPLQYPTAVDAVSPGLPRPTEVDAPPNAGMIPGAYHPPPTSLGSYSMDGNPSTLPPLLPASPPYMASPTARAAPSPQGAMGPYGPTPMAGPSPLDAGRGPTFSAGPMSLQGARPARGGIVFVVIGLSAVIAVLLVLLLWAFLPR